MYTYKIQTWVRKKNGPSIYIILELDDSMSSFNFKIGNSIPKGKAWHFQEPKTKWKIASMFCILANHVFC